MLSTTRQRVFVDCCRAVRGVLRPANRLGASQLIELHVFPLDGTLLGSDSNHMVTQHFYVKKNL